jgi:hypothetical protein
MTTTKNRINVSFSDIEEALLTRIAKRDQMPRATKVAQLVRLALEIEEDAYFSKLGDSILENDKRPSVPHSKAWN